MVSNCMANTGDKLKPRNPRPARKLTDKQLSFCKWYVSEGCNLNGTAAARRAGYQGTDATIRAIASQNLTKPLVRAEIDKRLAKAMSGANVTVENVLRKITVIGEKALEAEQYASAARCAELEGRYLKMFTDKIEHVQDIETATIEELERLLVEIVEAGGLDLRKLFARYGAGHGGGDDPPYSQKPH